MRTCKGLSFLPVHVVNDLCCQKATREASQASHSCAHPIAGTRAIAGVGAVVATAISALICGAGLVACTTVGRTTWLGRGLITNRRSLYNLLSAWLARVVARLMMAMPMPMPICLATILGHVRRAGTLAAAHADGCRQQQLNQAMAWASFLAHTPDNPRHNGQATCDTIATQTARISDEQ